MKKSQIKNKQKSSEMNYDKFTFIQNKIKIVSPPSCKLPDEFGPPAGFLGCFLENVIKSHTASGGVFVLILEVLGSNRYLRDPKKLAVLLPEWWSGNPLCSGAWPGSSGRRAVLSGLQR